MNILNITIKDIIQSSRSLSAFMFMFVIPILVTGLFYFIFSGIADGSGFQLPRTTVTLVNGDAGTLPEGLINEQSRGADNPIDFSKASNMGDILVTILSNEMFNQVMIVSVAQSAKEARTAVDNQEAQVAVIIPPDFSDSLMGQGESTTVQLYKDPTVTFGPVIVESILQQLIDDLVTNQIGVSTSLEQLAASGAKASPGLAQQILNDFSEQTRGQVSSGRNGSSALVQQVTVGQNEETIPLINQIVSIIFSGMMIFFAFFTGSATMQSILIEEEKGTLARLFTTPNSHRTILAGKGFASILTVTIQVTVLITFGIIVFRINWGHPIAVVFSSVALILVSASMGLLIVSLLQNTRQAGIVYGGVLTLTGMVGLIPIFTAGIPDQPELVSVLSLLVPQGWIARLFIETINGAIFRDLIPFLVGTLAWSLVFAFIGQYRLQKRFA